MKIAILGGTGLLGSNLVKLYSQHGLDVKAFSRSNSNNIDSEYNNVIDFKFMTDELLEYFQQWCPDIIINTVALVNLELCEKSPALANFTNVTIAENSSFIANKIGSYYIHISTDHFFTEERKFHSELAPIKIMNNYAKTKLVAEKKVKILTPEGLIVRTNILGFRNSNSPSFFEWLLSSLKSYESIELYKNYYTSPIAVRLLGKILLTCYAHKLNGIYNIASSDVISKYEFGVKVAKKFNLVMDNIRAGLIQNLDGSSSVSRAFNNGLDCHKIEKILLRKMPTTDETIEQLYNEYMEKGNE